MADDAFFFDAAGATRVVRAVRRVESEPRAVQQPGQPQPSFGANVQFLRVLAATLVGPGATLWYTARVELFDPLKGIWGSPSGLDVWLVQRSNYPLAPEMAVLGRQMGSSAGTVLAYPAPLLDDQGVPLFDEAGNPLTDDTLDQVLGEPRPLFATADKLAVLEVVCEAGQIVTTKG